MVAFKDVIISEFNVRDAECDVSDMISSIKDIGLLSKVIFRKKESKFELLAGLRRYKALKDMRGDEGNLTEDEYYTLDDIPDKKAVLISITENQRRVNFSPFELNRAILLLNREGYTPKEIAEYLGITPHRMKRLEKIGQEKNRMPDIVKEELSKRPEEARMNEAHWFKISEKTEDPDIIKDTVDFILEHETPPKDVPAILKSVEKNYKQDNIDPDSTGSSGSAVISDDPVNVVPTEDSPIEYTHKGELVLEKHGDIETLKVLGKDEDLEVPVDHYLEYLRHPEQFKCYVTFKLKVKPID